MKQRPDEAEKHLPHPDRSRQTTAAHADFPERLTGISVSRSGVSVSRPENLISAHGYPVGETEKTGDASIRKKSPTPISAQTGMQTRHTSARPHPFGHGR